MVSSVPPTASSTELAFYPHEIGENDLLDRMLPDEIMLKIFRFLDARSLAKCGKVSRRWREIASTELLWKAVSLKNVFPYLQVFDASDWLIHFGLKVEVVRVDGRKVLSALKKYRPQIKDDAGLTLLTIPKGLTFNQLLELAKNPRQGNVTPFGYIWEKIPMAIGDTPTSQTVQILIMRNVLNETQHLLVSAQKEFLRRIGCEMPKVIEVVALIVLTFVHSGERLYNNNDNSWIFTGCKEKINGHPLVVGGFSPEGLKIGRSLIDIGCIGGVLRF